MRGLAPSVIVVIILALLVIAAVAAFFMSTGGGAMGTAQARAVFEQSCPQVCRSWTPDTDLEWEYPTWTQACSTLYGVKPEFALGCLSFCGCPLKVDPCMLLCSESKGLLGNPSENCETRKNLAASGISGSLAYITECNETCNAVLKKC
jgi:hypothetical protein